MPALAAAGKCGRFELKMSVIAIFHQLTIETPALRKGTKEQASLAAHPLLSLRYRQMGSHRPCSLDNNRKWDTGRLVTYGMHDRETILHCSGRKRKVKETSGRR